MAKSLIDLERKFDSMRNQMNSLMGGFFDDDLAQPIIGSSGLRTPTTDIIDNENELIANIELPGVNKEDIKLSVDENTLYVEAEHKENNDDKNGEYTRIERRYSNFKRAIPLETQIDENEIKAEFNNGVLEVHLPKKHIENKNNLKQIEIS